MALGNNWHGEFYFDVATEGVYKLGVIVDWRQDVESNYTQVSLKRLRLTKTNSAYSFYNAYAKIGFHALNGQIQERTVNIDTSGPGPWEWAPPNGSIWSTLQHNDDGTLWRGHYTGAVYVNAGIGGQYNSPTGGWHTFNVDNIGIPDIPRMSGVSLDKTEVALGEKITFTFTKHSDGFRHDLEYRYNGNYCKTMTTGANTSYEWTVPTTIGENDPGSFLKNTASEPFVIRVFTKSGNSTIGYRDFPITIKAPASWIPSATINSIADSSTANKFGGFTQNLSIPKVTFSGSGSNGSTIKSYSVNIGGTLRTGSSSGAQIAVTGELLKTAGTVPVSVTLTDSRGRTKTVSQNLTVKAYSNPWISAFRVDRSDAQGNLNVGQKRAKVTYKYAVANTGSDSAANTASFVVQYRESGVSTWSDCFTLTSLTGNSSYVSNSDILALDKSYEFRATLTDKTGSSAGALASVSKSNPVINADVKKNSMGFGMHAPSTQNELDIALNTIFKGTIGADTENRTLNDALRRIIGKVMYPVGSVYINTSGTNPQTQFGGTWVQYLQGRIPIGVGSDTDGSVTVTFTAGQKNGRYRRNLSALIGAVANTPGSIGYDLEAAPRSTVSGYMVTGGGSKPESRTFNHSTRVIAREEANSNDVDFMPPTIGVYFWRRTA